MGDTDSPAFDRETGLVRYFPAVDGGRRRREWVNGHVVPAFRRAWKANPTIRSGAFVVEAYRNHANETVGLVLLVSERDEVAVPKNWVSSGRTDAPADGSGFARKVVHRWPSSDPMTALFGCCAPDPERQSSAAYVASLTVDLDATTVLMSMVTERELARPWLDGVLDVGVDTPYAFDPEDAERRRALLMTSKIEPQVRRGFDLHPQLRSAVALVAQYWNDQAIDEVHLNLIFSELETPDLTSEHAWYSFQRDEVNLPTVGKQPQWWGCGGDQLISLLASYCTEFGDQNEPEWRNHSPYAVFRRRAGAITCEVVGIQHRPWLEGRWWFDATLDPEVRDLGVPELDAYRASEQWLREPVDVDSLTWDGA